MVKTIQTPDPAKQHEKTPVYVDKTVTVKDEKGRDIQIKQKIMLTTGTGEATKVVKYSELSKLVADTELVGKATIQEGVTVESVKATVDLENPEKHGRWGLGCPYNCGRFWWFKPNEKLDGFVPVDDAAWMPKSPKVIEQTEVDVTKYEYDEEGKVTNPDEKKVTKTIHLIEDEQTRELKWVDEVPVTHGYLNWLPQPDGSVTLICDRCGEEINLVKGQVK